MLLIVIDTLRADHLGCYGHSAPTSPNLDALAARGTLFSRATTQVPVTQPAVSTILSGRLPFRHGVRDNTGFVLADEELTLSERAGEAGYRSAAIVASAVLTNGRGLEQGFQSYDAEFEADYPIYDRSLEVVADEVASTRRRADRVTDLAIERVRDFGDEPWFLFVHYFDPHSHYDPPPQDRELFAHPYDGEIHFVDREIRRLLDAIGEGRKLLVAVVGDHGESFGEHGEIGHGFLLHESTLHVPFILSGHGVPVGELRGDLVGLVDLEPTLAALMHLEPPTLARDGRDLFDPELREADQYAETLRTLISYDWAPLRALRRGDLKWIEGPRPRLFDLAVDPAEEQALTADDPRAGELAETLRSWIGEDDPRSIKAGLSEEDPERVEQLAALGYVGGGGSDPAPAELPDPADMLPIWNRRQFNRARYREAVTLLQLGNLDAAVALLDSVLSLEPSKLSALHNRATALMLMERAEEARADWRRALEIDPEYLPALRSLSRDRIQRGELARALGLLQSLARLEPADPEHHYNLGVCSDRLGLPEQAREALSRFLELVASDDQRRESVQHWISQHTEKDNR